MVPLQHPSTKEKKIKRKKNRHYRKGSEHSKVVAKHVDGFDAKMGGEGLERMEKMIKVLWHVNASSSYHIFFECTLSDETKGRKFVDVFLGVLLLRIGCCCQK